MPPLRSRRWLAVPLLLGACHGVMSTMDPASQESARIDHVARVLIVASVLVFVAVMALVLVAVTRGGPADTGVDMTPRRHDLIVYGGAVGPALMLTMLFIMSLGAMRRFPSAADANTITYRVIGHQWWWDIDYIGAGGPGAFRTANEMHVPVGRTVRVVLMSADVIHSFWVPQLQGKIDLIPGDTTEIRFTATRPGVYRGQCAEYCGLQHAHMAFDVVAEDSVHWKEWVSAELASAAVPTDSLASAGAVLVTTQACAKCHTIRGTPADATLGPDLTHVASRQSIAAGALPNNLATLEAWVADAQRLKPGALMPSMSQFTGDQLRAIASYLHGLR